MSRALAAVLSFCTAVAVGAIADMSAVPVVMGAYTGVVLTASVDAVVDASRRRWHDVRAELAASPIGTAVAYYPPTTMGRSDAGYPWAQWRGDGWRALAVARPDDGLVVSLERIGRFHGVLDTEDGTVSEADALGALMHFLGTEVPE